ncbi:hypothetical protein BJY04DRAFT_217139 [Aspergillus karnatakaensis]|uniref:DUF3455 domain-containing protein n=1 Tax=Aspergillus karnatakaensis TaxID=1810916 RepID=UPI003CCD8003
MWASTNFAMLSLLSITAVNATFPYRSSHSSIYTSLLQNFLQDLDLTSCALENTVLPQSTLPEPSEGLSLQSITLGRGTQNYTCATNTNTSTPEAVGATATLFDVSCLAALDNGDDSDSLLHILPDVLTSIPLGSTDFVTNILTRFTGQNLVIGKHYFTADGVPFFDLRGVDGAETRSNDYIAAKKDGDMDAPAKPGYGITGDVPWLKLKGVEGGFSEVYRLHTSGGSAPATCEGLPEVFTVDYTSEYWFYG